MGGPGSGAWLRWGKREVLESRLCIDVRRWKRDRLLQPGSLFGWQWSVGGKPTNGILVKAEAGHVVLQYRQRVRGGDWQSVEEPVWLSYTPCHFGGRRVWFVCPQCAERVAKLFLGIPPFVCRRCCGLPYACQNETRVDRALRAARKVRHILGADPDLSVPVRDKPKGMHWRTFGRLLQRAEEAEHVVDQGLGEVMARVLALGGYSPNRRDDA